MPEAIILKNQNNPSHALWELHVCELSNLQSSYFHSIKLFTFCNVFILLLPRGRRGQCCSSCFPNAYLDLNFLLHGSWRPESQCGLEAKRLGHGHVGRHCCGWKLALTPVTGQTPGSAGSHLVKPSVIITAGVPEGVSGLLSPFLLLGNDIQLSADAVVHISLLPPSLPHQQALLG